MAVRVAKIVDVVSLEAPFSPPPIASVVEGGVIFLVDTALLTPVASATGQTVVETIRVSVVKYVVLDLRGQLVTEDGHAVMVAVRVL